MVDLVRGLPVGVLVLAALTLGLAPFTPEPHVVEKLRLLVAGDLTAPIDIGDLLLHATPWVLLMARLALGGRSAASDDRRTTDSH